MRVSSAYEAIIERHPEKEIRAPLVKLTTQLPVLHIKLEQGMAGRQCHLVEFPGIPCRDQDPPAVRTRRDQAHRLRELIDRLPLRPLPRAPLRPVNPPKIPMLIGPFIPNRHAMLVQIAGIGVPAQKPKQFVDNRPHMHLLRRDKWKTLPQIEPRLRTKQAKGTRPRAVRPGTSLLENQIEQPMVFQHNAVSSASAARLAIIEKQT